jgi:hypothetical protein
VSNYEPLNEYELGTVRNPGYRNEVLRAASWAARLVERLLSTIDSRDAEIKALKDQNEKLTAHFTKRGMKPIDHSECDNDRLIAFMQCIARELAPDREGEARALPNEDMLISSVGSMRMDRDRLQKELINAHKRLSALLPIERKYPTKPVSSLVVLLQKVEETVAELRRRQDCIQLLDDYDKLYERLKFIGGVVRGEVEPHD